MLYILASDLKLYRKIKDRERQEKKEEIKKRITDKQQSMIQEILREQRTELHLIENTVSTNSASSYVDGSRVRVKVKCFSSEKENENSMNSEESHIETGRKFDTQKPLFKSRRILDHYSLKSNDVACDNEDDGKHYIKNKNKFSGYSVKGHTEAQNNIKIENEKMHIRKATALQSDRPMSAPNILEHQQNPIGSSQTKSTTSTKNTHSGTKSCKYNV